MPYAKEITTTAKSEYYLRSCSRTSNLVIIISLRIIRILDKKPQLARDIHPSVLTALQVAVVDRKPANINPILSQSDHSDSDSDSDSDGSWAIRRRRRRHGPTPLHYACLLGNMKIVEVLLRNGAEWKISDGNGLLPEDYAGVNGDRKMQEFKGLCKEEELRRSGMLAEEEELRWAGRFAEELELDREKEKTELEQLKKHEAQNELEKKKLGEEEQLRKTQCKWFFILPTTNCTYEFLLTL